MMVFFLSNMIENQLMSTGAFEITLNGELIQTGVLKRSNIMNEYLKKCCI